MLKLVVIAALLLTVNALGEEKKWQEFKVKFGRTYSNVEEEQKRFAIFRENLEKIESHNEKFEQGLTPYRKGINKFTDMTQEEFVSSVGYVGNRRNSLQNVKFEISADAVIPDSINWAEQGAVTEVQDQGTCGSCWAFSAAGSIESQYYIKNKKLITLSKQNLVDCASAYGNQGCYGGITDWAFGYIHDSGIMSEEEYPYVGVEKTCRFNPSTSVTKIQSFVDIPKNETLLQAAVATIGTISVAVDYIGFSSYEGGVFDYKDCETNYVNHCVLLVGYGTTDNGIDYWLVKNSFGKDWGEDGYIRMSRNKGNQCGIATAASYPII